MCGASNRRLILCVVDALQNLSSACECCFHLVLIFHVSLSCTSRSTASGSPVLTRAGICVPPTVTYLPYRVSGSILNDRRAFSAAGPMAWNSLPDFNQDPTSSTDCFRRLLNGLITIAIRARFEYDSTTIRLQHATTRYEVFRSLAYEIVYENQW